MCLGSLRQVDQLGHAGLHPEGRLVRGDPRGDLGVVDDFVLDRIERADGVDHVALAVRGRPRWGRPM